MESTQDFQIEQLQRENAQLREQLEWFKRHVFGKRSERVVKDLDGGNVQLLPGFEEWLKQGEEPNEVKEKTILSHKRKIANKGKDKITVPEDLPVERIEIDLPEEEKICSETGLSLQKIGEEVSRKLAHIPGKYFIREYVRPIYALPKESEGGIRTAYLPDSIIPKCRADESLLAEITVKKYGDHLPLYRICEIMAREEIGISRQLLSQWVGKIGHALKPLYDLMHQEILKSGNIFVDESPVDMLMPGKGSTHKSYMWVVAGGKERDPPNRIYHFATGRQHAHAFDLIGDYSGILHSDKYSAYEKLAAEKKLVWSPCYSHIRRKFFEAESGDQKFREWILGKFKDLFQLEEQAWEQSPEERLQIRQKDEVPIIDEMIAAVKKKLIEGKILPKSKFKEALGYFSSLIPHLKNYTKDPWARIDNNVAERAVRSLAIGRKNWLFVGSEDGGEAAAVLLSFVQTCRGLKINPRQYLEDIFRRIMSHPHKNLFELLPHNWAKRPNAA